MEPIIAVGLESTVDVWVTFPTLASFEGFADDYDAPLAEHVEDAYSVIREGIGGEVPIDGKADEARELIRAASDRGAEIRRSLGGNGAQEAAALRALGLGVAFVGGISPRQIADLPPEDRKFFEGVDSSFAHISDEYRPISVILQARGTNRYILCEGRGRRIEQLRPYLRELPDSIKQIAREHGEPSMINLVGWHVLFAGGVNDQDFRLVKNVVGGIRSLVDSPLFTDAGGLDALDEGGRRSLCNVYSLFDILSVNEDEVKQVACTMGSGARDEFQAMHDILDSLENPSTIWLHSRDYQASLSTKYRRGLLKDAQIAAATAGVHRMEKGTYPTREEITRRAEIGNYSERGLEKVKKATESHGDEIGGASLVVTPCYKARGFTSTVGAGDTAAAVYTYTISAPLAK